MDRSTLYEDDIYAWAQQQAEALRRLAVSRRDLPNELDWENVAEEIEDVGKSELRRAESFILQIFVHLIKLASVPEARSRRKWINEVLAFHAQLLKEITPSMHGSLDLEHQWRLASLKAEGDLSEHGDALLSGLPTHPPFVLADVLVEELAIEQAVARLRPE